MKLQALLVLDGDEQARLFPRLDRQIGWLERDQRTGALPEDADVLVAHLMTAALYLGYGIFREQIAREADIPLEDLDRRSVEIARHMFAGIAQNAGDEHRSA